MNQLIIYSMKRIYTFLFVTMAMLMLSICSAWAQYVKLTDENGTESWIEIEGTINGTNIEIYKGEYERAINKSTKGSIDLNEVWSESGGRGTNYQVTSIGDYAFQACMGLVSVNIPSSVTSIEDYAFSMCSGLTSMTIPNSVTSIGNSAFSGCNGLTSIVMEPGNTKYDSRNNCNAIIETASNTLIVGCKNTKIPSSVTSIGGGAFSGCSGLTSIEIPSSVMSIENTAFFNCRGLTSVVIPSSVTSIGYGAFSGCSGLTSVEINTNTIDTWFSGLTSIKTITLGEEVKSIGWSAFSSCSGLTSIEISSNVTSIGNSAFSGCSGLTSIVIPSNVTSIGSYAFQNCTSLSDITSEITDVFVTATNAFAGCENATLHVPAGTYVAYSGRADWNRIIHIVEGTEGFKMTMACNTKGSVLVNNETIFTNKIKDVEVNEEEENTFEFIPNEGCKLEQVLLNGLDVISSVENNTLKAVIPANSQMNVVFSKVGDMNNNGKIDISDVVLLVNMILGQ